MTGLNTTPITPLSKKLSLVMHHHLFTSVPELELDNWNYESWAYFFEQLCSSYDVDKYLHTPTAESTLSSSAPLTSEELKVDKIVLSWILFTLSDSLRPWLVIAWPKSAKEAWGLISDIVKDNKRFRTNTLKDELCSIKLGDQSMESYFQKIDSIVNIFESLYARVNDEDVVHYVLEGLPDTYNHVFGYMHWKDTFPDLKTVRSLLITEEMRLKSKISTLLVDSSSPMGNCRYDATCRYSHDANARSIGAASGDFMTRRVLLRCDSTGDLYPVIAPSLILHAFLVSQHTWHQRLGHPGSDVFRRLVSNNVISCNKEKPPVLCHACQL
nr:ribonuclease H-like domain-containing protein [Tanacetum cinerariifolium]